MPPRDRDDNTQHAQTFPWRSLPFDVCMLVLAHTTSIDDQASFALADPRMAVQVMRAGGVRAFRDPILHLAIQLRLQRIVAMQASAQSPLAPLEGPRLPVGVVRTYCQMAYASRSGIAWMRDEPANVHRLVVRHLTTGKFRGGTVVIMLDDPVRVEFAPGHPAHGHVYTFKQRNLRCTQFAEGHKEHGRIVYAASGDTQRVSFVPPHPLQGISRFFESNQHVRSEYAKPHRLHGRVDFFCDGKLARCEYEPWHEYHGYVAFFANGTRERVQYAPGNQLYGTARHA